MGPERVTHYELRRLIGRGGMGEVHEAFDLKAKRLVALKFIAPELAGDPESFRRFEAEAHNAAALQHPHIATLFEFEPEGARPFIAMELVGGPSLRARIRQGPLPVPEALAIARDVAAALAYAHRRNIVHRDIKPENLMFDEEGRVKVMDFGLARALLASRLTLTGSTLGTPSYMAPESVSGPAGPAADVFALGLVLHEMLTGQQAFAGESPLAVMFAIANTDPPAVRDGRPDAPDDVVALVDRLLARDPAERMDAAGAARELARLTGASLSTVEGPASSPGAAARAAEAGGALSSARTVAVDRPLPAWRRPAVVAVLSLLAAGALASGGVVATRVWNARHRVPPERHQQAVSLTNQALEAYNSGDLAHAQTLVTAALEKDPAYGEAQMNLAAIYEQKGQPDSAVTLYGHVLRAHAKEPRLLAMAHYNLADIDLRAGAYDRALEHMRASFALDSGQVRAYNGLGLTLVRAGRPQEALGLLDRGIAQFPGAAPLYKNAGFAAMELQDDSTAVRYLDRALASDPTYASALGLRAWARAKLGDRPGALADWHRFAAADTAADPRERNEIAHALRERGINVGADVGAGADRRP